MPLDFQTVDVKFTQGLDTRTNKKLVVPGRWNLLENCTQATTGTLVKRDGVAPALVSAVGNGLATFNSELLVVNGSKISSVASPTGNPNTVPMSAVSMAGQVGFMGVTKAQIRGTSGYQEGMDCSYGAGLTAYVWNDFTAAGASTGPMLTVVDETSGAHVVAPVLLGAGSRCRVVFSVDAFFVFYRNPTGTPSLRCRTVTVAAGVPTLNAEVTLISSANFTDANFDACEFMDTGTVGSVALSYVWGDGANSVRAIRITQAAGLPSIATGPVNLFTEANMGFAGIMGIGVCWMTSTGAGNYVTFVFGTAGAQAGTSVRILDNTFISAAASMVVDATVPAVATFCHVCAVGNDTANQALVFTDQQSSIGAAAAVQPLRRTEISLTAGVITVVSSSTLINSVVGIGGAAVIAPPQGPFICGKPIVIGQFDFTPGTLLPGKVFLPVCVMEFYAATITSTLNLQNSFFLLDAATGAVVSKALYGSYGIPARVAVAPNVYTPSSAAELRFDGAFGIARSARYGLACTERGSLSFENGINITQTGMVRLAFEPMSVQAPIRTQLGPATYFAGGSLSIYDGQGVTEMGFPLFPEGIAAVVSAGGAMTVGTHQVVSVYEWVDGQGQRHQSAPSLPVSFTITGGQQTVTITTPTIMLSQKAGISIVNYVTQNAGLTFNRVTPLGTPVLNSTAAASVNEVVTIADADFAANELLYTQPLQAGTALPSDAPGPCSILAVHANRLFVDLTDKQGVVRYSQPLTQGVGLQWNGSLGFTTPVDGGRLVGFADMDEKVVIFCERKLYFISGTGPAPSGAFNNYSEPIEIPSDVGCSSARSILKLPAGVVFKTQKGFYLLGRDLTVRYIGDAVAAYDALEVMSACYLEDRQEARFTTAGSLHLGQGTTEIGKTLVYSYVENQWSTSTIRVVPAAGSARTLVMYDALWWPALRLFMSVSLVDGLSMDVPGATDDTLPASVVAPVIMSARTSFFHLATLEGFQRVRWLYLTATIPGGLTATTGVKIVVDYDDVYSAVTPPGATGSYTATGIQVLATYGTGETIDFRHKLHRQKCKSVAFTFSNLDTFASFAGISGFEALSLEVGLKKGTNKLASTQTVG